MSTYVADTTAPAVHIPSWSRGTVLRVWAAAALPMATLVWIVGPLLAHSLDGPTALSRALILTLTAGMIWQFLLVMLLVRREQGSLRWSVLKEALWLRPPRSPADGRRGGRLWWVLVPMIAALAVEELLPTLPTPPARDLGLFLSSHAGQSFLSGNWLWLAIC